jgi:hypothetical protein
MKRNHLNHSAIWIERILLLSMIATPCITLLVPLLNPDLAIAPFRELLEQSNDARPLEFYMPEFTLLIQTLTMLTALVIDGIFVMILWQLKQLCSGYRHQQLFTLEQINRYRKLGIWVCLIFVGNLISTPLLSLIMSMHAPERLLTIQLQTSDFRVLLVGIAVLALSRVMREAKLLADEQQLTV